MTAISTAQSKINDFHSKMNIAPHERLMKMQVNHDLRNTASRLAAMKSKLLELYQESDDSRLLRMHLILEEAGELASSLANSDEQGALDAVGDLLYVTIGTATVYHLPLEEAFDEIHESNMSKERQPDDPEGDRVRDKGPNYRPPNLTQFLPLIDEAFRHDEREHDSRIIAAKAKGQ